MVIESIHACECACMYINVHVPCDFSGMDLYDLENTKVYSLREYLHFQKTLSCLWKRTIVAHLVHCFVHINTISTAVSSCV